MQVMVRGWHSAEGRVVMGLVGVFGLVGGGLRGLRRCEGLELLLIWVMQTINGVP